MNNLNRRTFLGSSLGVAAIGLLAACTSNDSSSTSGSATASASSPTGALAFDASTYTEQTTTITTDAGDQEVAYRFFGPITYVENPVDEEYQSLVISVPTSINGSKVDTANAPIVFVNSVGGYMAASVASATTVNGGGGAMGGPGGAPGGAMPSGEAPSGAAPDFSSSSESTASSDSSSGIVNAEAGSNAMLDSSGNNVSIAELSLAAGYVVVEVGCRGRTLTNDAGEYYGVAPAAIVDLKAALRYLHYNSALLPGNTDRIVTTGTSAGGALSALMGASGNSPLYDSYLQELGAADASDAIFASGDWCPIIDLEHADMAYEWCWNSLSYSSDIDTDISSTLKDGFTDYLASLKLTTAAQGALNVDNYSDYLVETFLQPAATEYLAALSDSDRETYLSENSFITWSNNSATFSWEDFLSHIGSRSKAAPAFDAVDLSSGENNLFGLGTTEARHFTEFSAEQAGETVAEDIPEKLNLMNPMYHLAQNNTDRAQHWWIRVGTADTDTSLSIVGNLAAKLNNLGADVNAKMYWDSGHGANTDAADFITWVKTISA